MSREDRVPVSQPEEVTHDFDPSADQEFVSTSLIGTGYSKSARKHDPRTFRESDFESGLENPYKDTTESDINIRHIPLGDLVPRPFKTYEQVIFASYVSVILFLVTGLLAVRYAWRGRRHQSKGLMGMAQRDLKLAVWFIYASVGLGILVYLIIIPIAVSI